MTTQAPPRPSRATPTELTPRASSEPAPAHPQTSGRGSGILLPFSWEQGEHVTLIGETGSGKTTLAAHLLAARSHVIAVRTKSDDTKIPGRLIKRTRDVERYAAESRFLLQPELGNPAAQRDEIARAFMYTWSHSNKRGGWTMFLDEALYIDLDLGLGGYQRRIATQGRSMKLTGIFGLQRPVGGPRISYVLSQPRHMITFGLDGNDAKTFAEHTASWLRDPVQLLGAHEFLWYYRPDKLYRLGTLDLRAGQIRALTPPIGRPDTRRER